MSEYSLTKYDYGSPIKVLKDLQFHNKVIVDAKKDLTGDYERGYYLSSLHTYRYITKALIQLEERESQCV